MSITKTRLSAKTKDRIKRLMPKGVPRYIRIYDEGENRYDRYTVVFTRNSANMYVGMSGSPFHPQGFCQHGESSDKGRPIDVNDAGWPPNYGDSNHLGKRIKYDALPDDCKKVVIKDYCEIWGIDPEDFQIWINQYSSK